MRTTLGVPLVRAGQMHPRIAFLDRIGAPTERGLARNKLPPNLRERPHILVSAHANAAFAEDMARREGIEAFGWRTALGGLQQMSPVLVRAVGHSPTLLHALETVCARARGESSNLQMWLEERGDALFFRHRGPIAREAPGADELSMMRAAIMISIVRIFTAPDWVPSECGFSVAGEIGPLIREELRDARVLRTRDNGWLRLPRSILASAPRTRLPVETRPGTELGNDPAQDLVGSLVQLLLPYLPMGPPSIRDAAYLADMSVRTLQRELARAGDSYRAVLQRTKFAAARELLGQPEVKILEVSLATGFSDAADFSRFFRRIAGMTPRDYRRTLL